MSQSSCADERTSDPWRSWRLGVLIPRPGGDGARTGAMPPGVPQRAALAGRVRFADLETSRDPRRVRWSRRTAEARPVTRGPRMLLSGGELSELSALRDTWGHGWRALVTQVLLVTRTGRHKPTRSTRRTLLVRLARSGRIDRGPHGDPDHPPAGSAAGSVRRRGEDDSPSPRPPAKVTGPPRSRREVPITSHGTPSAWAAAPSAVGTP